MFDVYEEFTASLVYHYLIENEHLKTAKLLLKERKKCEISPVVEELKKVMTASKLISCIIADNTGNFEVTKLSNTVVYNYLKNHKKSGVQELANKMKDLVPIELEGQTPNFEDVFYHALLTRKILVPVRKKKSNDDSSRSKVQNLSVKIVSDHTVRTKEVLAPDRNVVNYSVGSGEKGVPIKEVFKSLKKTEIKILKQGKTEVFKALQYILKSDIKVMKAQADSVSMKLHVDNDTVIISPENSEQLEEMNVKLGVFSRATFCENSEESNIVKAWHDLIKEAKIIDEKQLIQDFDNLLTEQWPCNVVGMYMSKYLKEPRHALKVYELLSESVKQVSEKVQKSNENSVPSKNIVNHSLGSGEKVVPIKDVFKDRTVYVEAYKEDKPEVFKVLKYILESGIKVMKAQADTIALIFEVGNDCVKASVKVGKKLLDNNIKSGKFSKAMDGENSEQCKIAKAWHELIEKAQIIDKKQLIQDFDGLMNEHWQCNIIGCYVSKHLEVPRHPLKVFELLARSVFYNSGSFQEEEDEFMMEHIESKNGKYDLNYLKAQLNRPRYTIDRRITTHILKLNPKKGQRFTIDEDLMIMKHILGTKFSSEPNEILEICNGKKSWKTLQPEINRNGHALIIRWSQIIYPTILSYLSGTVNLHWKRALFQFIIDKQYVSVTDIDKSFVAERWPSVPITKLVQTIKMFSVKNGKKGLPLYQNIAENLHHVKISSKKVSQIKLDLINEFEELRNKE